MRPQNRRLERAAPFGFSLITVFMTTSAMAWDWESWKYPGINCQTDYLDDGISFWRGGVGDGDHAWSEWHCPVPRKDGSSAPRIAQVRVRVRDSSAIDKVICRLYNVSSTDAMTLIDYANTSDGGVYNTTLYLYADEGDITGTVHFVCEVPSTYNGVNSRLMNYEVRYVYD